MLRVVRLFLCSRSGAMVVISAMARRVALRYRQKGKALRTRRKRYRQTKQKSRRQSARWRKKNPGKVKRYQKKRQRNPQKHRMRRRASEVLFSQQIPYWDEQKGQEGEVESVLPEDDKVQVTMGDQTLLLDLFEFLDSAAFMEEGSEAEFFELLDPLYDGPEDEGVPDRQARRRKLPRSVLITATVTFRHEGKPVVATVERTNWLGGKQMMYYWRTSEGRRIETLGLPEDLVVLDKGR